MALFQEQLRHEPFWMLVACVLVNRTTWHAVEPVLDEIRERWPTADDLFINGKDELQELLEPLGSGWTRCKIIRDLAMEWGCRERTIGLPCTSEDVRSLPGCGKYAVDSWAIFVERDFAVKPIDRALKEYLRERVKI